MNPTETDQPSTICRARHQKDPRCAPASLSRVSTPRPVVPAPKKQMQGTVGNKIHDLMMMMMMMMMMIND